MAKNLKQSAEKNIVRRVAQKKFRNFNVKNGGENFMARVEERICPMCGKNFVDEMKHGGVKKYCSRK